MKTQKSFVCAATRAVWTDEFNRLSQVQLRDEVPVDHPGEICLPRSHSVGVTIRGCKDMANWEYSDVSTQLTKEMCALLVRMVRDTVKYKESIGSAPPFRGRGDIILQMGCLCFFPAIVAFGLNWLLGAILVAISIGLCTVSCNMANSTKARHQYAQYQHQYGDAVDSVYVLFERNFGDHIIEPKPQLCRAFQGDHDQGIKVFRCSFTLRLCEYVQKCAHCDLAYDQCNGVHQIS